MTPSTSIANFEHMPHFVLLLLLLSLNKCMLVESEVSNNEFVLSNCEKYIGLWAGDICWAIYFHSYSPNIRF